MDKRLEGITRIINDMDEAFGSFATPFRVKTLSLGALYDPERYELTPRKDFIERRLKEKEEEIAMLERNRESTLKYYGLRIAKAKEEREKLTNK